MTRKNPFLLGWERRDGGKKKRGKETRRDRGRRKEGKEPTREKERFKQLERSIKKNKVFPWWEKNRFDPWDTVFKCKAKVLNRAEKKGKK